MIDLYLRAADEAALLFALRAAGLTAPDEDGVERPVTASHSHALDVIGLIYAPTGGTVAGPDGVESLELAPVDGWHANLRLREAGTASEASLRAAGVVIKPDTPERVWA